MNDLNNIQYNVKPSLIKNNNNFSKKYNNSFNILRYILNI